jgi:hypothetical protein
MENWKYENEIFKVKFINKKNPREESQGDVLL